MKLKELCNVTSSKRIFASQYQNSGIPFYRGKEISLLSNNEKIKQELYISEELYQEINEKYGVPKKDDILMTAVGTIGNCYIVKDEKIYFKDGNIIWLKDIDNKKILPKYLYYYLNLNSTKNTIDSLLIGSTQKALTIESFKNIEIDIPNIEIQSKIVKLLNILNNKIRLNTDVNNNLYELGKALYKKYFKDLPADNTKKLGELCNIKYGKGLPTKKIEKEGYPVYGGNGIIGYYHEFMYDDSQVLISCRGAASGNVIVSKPKSFVTNNSLILESDRKYHHYLKQYSLDNYYYEYITGSAQPQITIDNIKDIVLIIPSDELLEAFNKQMDSLELKAFANLEELEKLKKLRDTLLPKLMNGEIDLDNIEI